MGAPVRIRGLFFAVARTIQSAGQIAATLDRLAKSVCRGEVDLARLTLVGIRTRGVILAERLQALIRKEKRLTLPVGILDITLYRDDLTSVAAQPVVKRTEIPFSLEGKGIVLVDDVLYTGRTIRAALDALIDFGRPAFIKLLCLVDRGWRELPIQADYVGITLKTKPTDNVKVYLKETDGSDGISIV